MEFILSLPAFFWLLVSGVFFAAGEYFSKEFALGATWKIFFLLIAVDALSIITWLPAIMQKNKLSTIGTLWSVLSLLLTVLIGVLIFKEKIDLVSGLGIFFAFISIILLSLA